MHIAAMVTVMLALLLGAASVEAQGCITRDEAITVIAHKVDVEHGGRLDKTLIWQIADRESGLRHCDAAGNVKVSPTADHGLLQLNENGVWLNCRVNPYCNRPDLINDPYLQIDVMLNYADVYGDLCPWNPGSNYMPGCGYGTAVKSGAARRAPSVLASQEQGTTPPMGDGPSRPQRGGDQ